ncbi:RTN1 [Cyberlindnera jadinii]|uniref:Reticulon-like protein n=1 Tax=Cyberlindnera jadinii (strain ATCC 18201 / CBS 1600 / BCRC 20928 / JCM 3617 / NBRC 0987 / NRRL Y-1542) TaxID=983966 RepID=A0A0H5C3X2_CYBJN|nr:RTN1 [Cyberlindnera jadinii]
MSAPATTAQAPKAIFPPILTWKDPVKTGKVFGTIIAALIVLKSVNLLNLFFRIGAFTLVTSAVAEYAGKFVTGSGLVTRFRPAYTTVVSTKGQKALECLANRLPALEESVQKLIYSADIEKTLKAGALFYILFKITSWLSLNTLIFTATILGFSLPAIYEKNQVQINAAVKEFSALVGEKASEYSKVAQEKAAPYIKQADEKLGPVSKFIKEKYQVRTAGSTVGSTSSKAAAVPVETTPVASTTSGAQIVPENAANLKATNPFETTTGATEFPSVPETKPLLEEVTEAAKAQGVNIDELKEASTNF